jgi:hypothetical protein
VRNWGTPAVPGPTLNIMPSDQRLRPSQTDCTTRWSEEITATVPFYEGANLIPTTTTEDEDPHALTSHTGIAFEFPACLKQTPQGGKSHKCVRNCLQAKSCEIRCNFPCKQRIAKMASSVSWRAFSAWVRWRIFYQNQFWSGSSTASPSASFSGRSESYWGPNRHSGGGVLSLVLEAGSPLSGRQRL